MINVSGMIIYWMIVIASAVVVIDSVINIIKDLKHHGFKKGKKVVIINIFIIIIIALAWYELSNYPVLHLSGIK